MSQTHVWWVKNVWDAVGCWGPGLFAAECCTAVSGPGWAGPSTLWWSACNTTKKGTTVSKSSIKIVNDILCLCEVYWHALVTSKYLSFCVVHLFINLRNKNMNFWIEKAIHLTEYFETPTYFTYSHNKKQYFKFLFMINIYIKKLYKIKQKVRQHVSKL